MKLKIGVMILFGALLICMSANLLFADKVIGSERIAGVWVVDKEKMMLESEELLEQARAKAKELNIESVEEQLKRLEDSHIKKTDFIGAMIFHLNKDRSGGVFFNIAGAKGVRGTYTGATSLLLWKIEGNKVKITLYDHPYGYLKTREMEFLLDGKNLITETKNPAREIKPNETNLLLLFDLEKCYLKKVDLDSPLMQKPKVLLPKEVKLEVPEGFERAGNEIFNISNRSEKINYSVKADYELSKYNRPGKEKATHEDILAMLTKRWQDSLIKGFPKAKLTTGIEMLDGIKAGYVSGLLDENSKYTEGPFYWKQYFTVDDGLTVINITINAGSPKRLEYLDNYVKKIKLNMTKTWTVTMEEVMEAKQKTEEYMKQKSRKID